MFMASESEKFRATACVIHNEVSEICETKIKAFGTCIYIGQYKYINACIECGLAIVNTCKSYINTFRGRDL